MSDLVAYRLIPPPTLHWHSERDGISGSDRDKVTVTPE